MAKSRFDHRNPPLPCATNVWRAECDCVNCVSIRAGHGRAMSDREIEIDRLAKKNQRRPQPRPAVRIPGLFPDVLRLKSKEAA